LFFAPIFFGRLVVLFGGVASCFFRCCALLLSVLRAASFGVALCFIFVFMSRFG